METNICITPSSRWFCTQSDAVRAGGGHNLALLEAILFPFVEEICLGTAEIDNFWAAVTVFLLNGALLAVKCVGNPHTAADDAAAFVRAIIALVADPHHGARAAGPRGQGGEQRRVSAAGPHRTRAGSGAGQTRIRVQGEPSAGHSPHVRVADDALAVALFAQAASCCDDAARRQTARAERQRDRRRAGMGARQLRMGRLTDTRLLAA